MPMRRDEILASVKQIVLEYLGDTGAQIYLFGSWALGKEARGSDIDVGVWYEKPLPAGSLSHLRDALEESTLPYSIDLVDLTRTDPFFREKVIKEAEVWNT